MNDIKAIIAKNIAALRQAKGLTQSELALRLNYSDKAVSKWERGESLPDIAVLVELAELFGVSVDSLVREADSLELPSKKRLRRRAIILAMSVVLVWLIAQFVFFAVATALDGAPAWLAYIWAVPASLIVWLVLNSVWFGGRRNFLIISLLMWALLAAVHLSFLAFGHNLWLVYLLGVPGQGIILLWSRMK